jgi:hypothetical protein
MGRVVRSLARAAGLMLWSCSLGAVPGRLAAAPVPPSAFEFDWLGHTKPVALDSLDRFDVIECVGSRDTRILTHGAGATRGFVVRSDPRGVWLEQVSGGKPRTRFVAWDGVTHVDCRESRPRTSGEGWELGFTIGFAVGIVTVIALTDPPGDFGDLVYPLTVVIGAIPFGVVGGLVGMAHPGTTTGWTRCWP